METKVTFVDRRTKEDSSKDCQVMQVPFKIHYNGPADVQNRVAKLLTTQDSNELTTEFRSRPLKGAKQSVPEGYVGLVTDLDRNSTSESRSKLNSNLNSKLNDSKQSLHISKEFKEFIYWNWDKTATSEDPQVKLLDWPQLAASLHSSES